MLSKCAVFLVLFLAVPKTSMPTYDYLYRNLVGQALNRFALTLIQPIHYSTEHVMRCLTPIHPGENGNHQSVMMEIGIRGFVFLANLASFPLTGTWWCLGGIVDAIGDSIKSKPYSQLKGLPQEKINTADTYTFFSLNACMFWGGLPIFFGGVRPARERMQDIADLIREKNADFLILQEVSYDPALALWDKINDLYPHGYTRIQPSSWLKIESCLFIASKYRIIGKPRCIPLPITSNINRVLFYFETDPFWVLTTYLDPGIDEEAMELRKKQMDVIVKVVAELEKTKPCIILGDFNIKREGKNDGEYRALIQENFYDSNASIPFSQSNATWTSLLSQYIWGKKDSKEDDFELLDYVLVNKESAHQMELDVELVQTFDLSTSQTKAKSISDHRGYFTRVLIKKWGVEPRVESRYSIGQKQSK